MSNSGMKHICMIVVLAMSVAARAQVLPIRAIYHRPAQVNYIAQVANPATRTVALQTLDQNFYGLAVNLYANTVIIRIQDNDAAPGGEGGGGFPYNVSNPYFAQAQELIVELAQKYGMKVIFAIEFSGYHRWVASGDLWNCYSSPGTQCGAYGYIHAAIDSTPFYGTQTVTGGSVVGLPDPTHTRSFINDSRIAGWMLDGEWDFNSAETNFFNADHAFLSKYWGFFVSLVHYNGANSSFAALYPKGSIDGGNNDSNCSDGYGRLTYVYTNIEGMMQFLASQPSHPTDYFMVEWYGNGTYPLACVGNDVGALLQGIPALAQLYGLPNRPVLLAEGGTTQVSNGTAAKQFMENAVNAAAAGGGAGFAGQWDSDGLFDLMYTGSCPSAYKTTPPGTLFTQNGIQADGQGYLNSNFRDFSLATENVGYYFTWCNSLAPSPSIGYHYQPSPNSDPTLASSWIVLTQHYLTAVGLQYWASETSEGIGVASAFCRHSTNPPPANCPAP